MEKTLYKYGKSLSKAFTMLLLLMVAMTSCDRRELEVMEPQKARFRLVVDWADVDWMQYYGSIPSGMTVMLFGDKLSAPIVELTNNVTSVELNLDPDHYKLVIFNNSVSEFGSMKFENMNTYENMSITASKFQPMQTTEWNKTTVFDRDPEKIGTVLEEFEVTEEMLLSQVNFYPYDKWLKALRASTRFYQEDDLTYVLKVDVKPITSMLYVRVHVTGMKNMRTVEGSISGMANGYHITEDHPAAGGALQLLDSWSASLDPDLKNGWIVTSIPVWGEPFGNELAANRPDDLHQLKLHFLLRDGKTEVDFTYNVGKKIRYIKQNAQGE